MKNLSLVALLFLAMPAFAKITVFSAGDALSHVLSSGQSSDAKRALPKGYDLTAVNITQTGKAPTNSFQIVMVYSPAVPPPAGIQADCFVTAETRSHVVQVGPNNSITASELTVPVVHAPSCQK